jgi:AraC-like DNA-binding protein
MLALSRRPAPPLSDFVDLIWLYQGCEGRPHVKERILPTGTVGMVINLQEDETRTYDREDTGLVHRTGGATVTGARSEFIVIDTAEQQWVMGVEFKPGGAAPFLRRPASELQDTQVPLDALWGAPGRTLRERLLEAPSSEARLGVLERALLEAAARNLERHPAVRFAVREFLQVPHVRTVADVTGQLGWSPRRFIQTFSEQVGLTPKLFCRVRRFQAALRLLQGQGRIDWTETALSCGYFDQAHFNRDFRAFSGLNPSAYAAHRTAFPNHVPILA